jgi:hypothetical protein
VTAPSAPGRSSARLFFRVAVIVASVVAAIVGSVLLATQRSSEKVNGPTGSIAAPVLPPGGNVVAQIRIERGNVVLGQKGGGPLAVGEGAVWAMSDAKSTLMRIDPARNAVVARSAPRRRSPPATAPSGSHIRPGTKSPASIRQRTRSLRPSRSVRGRRASPSRRSPSGSQTGAARASHGSIPPRIESWRRSASARRAPVVRSTRT